MAERREDRLAKMTDKREDRPGNSGHSTRGGSSDKPEKQREDRPGNPGYLPRGGACVSCRRRKMVMRLPHFILC